MSGWHDTANVLDNPTEIFRFLLLEPPFEREWFSSARKRMTFAAHLSSTLKAESIKVYLAGVRSLHLEHRLANPR